MGRRVEGRLREGKRRVVGRGRAGVMLVGTRPEANRERETSSAGGGPGDSRETLLKPQLPISSEAAVNH